MTFCGFRSRLNDVLSVGCRDRLRNLRGERNKAHLAKRGHKWGAFPICSETHLLRSFVTNARGEDQANIIGNGRFRPKRAVQIGNAPHK